MADQGPRNASWAARNDLGVHQSPTDRRPPKQPGKGWHSNMSRRVVLLGRQLQFSHGIMSPSLYGQITLVGFQQLLEKRSFAAAAQSVRSKILNDSMTSHTLAMKTVEALPSRAVN